VQTFRKRRAGLSATAGLSCSIGGTTGMEMNHLGKMHEKMGW